MTKESETHQTVRIPKSLIRVLKSVASQQHLSLSKYVELVLRGMATAPKEGREA